jgi:hypothetical protein
MILPRKTGAMVATLALQERSDTLDQHRLESTELLRSISNFAPQCAKEKESILSKRYTPTPR